MRLAGVHLLALTLMMYDGGVDNLVVVFTILVTGIGSWRHIDIRHRCAGIGLYTEGTQRTECANGRLTVALACLAKAVLADKYIGNEQHFAIDSQAGLASTALHVIYFE